MGGDSVLENLFFGFPGNAPAFFSVFWRICPTHVFVSYVLNIFPCLYGIAVGLATGCGPSDQWKGMNMGMGYGYRHGHSWAG